MYVVVASIVLLCCFTALSGLAGLRNKPQWEHHTSDGPGHFDSSVGARC